MGYSENEDMVEAVFFKSTGKWYMTEALDMSGCFKEITPVEAVKKALKNRGRGNSFTVVVLNPSHMAPYPVMLVAGTYNKDD